MKLYPVFLASALVLFSLSVSGCKDEVEKLELSDSEKARIVHLQNPFGPQLIRFTEVGEKGPVLLGLDNCKVYRAKIEQGVVLGWEMVLKGFYPFFTACTQQSIEYDGHYARVFLCEQAIGAGGGCAAGGNYRSLDGSNWEEKKGNQWTKVE